MPPLNSILALAGIVILALSTGPVHVNALVADRAQVARHAHGHAHDAVARRKRSDSNASSGHCKPRSPSSTPPPPMSTPPTSAPPTSTSPTSAPPPSTSSSSAPATTPTSTSDNSGKKWCLAGTDLYTQDGMQFTSLPKVGFYYNWDVNPPDVLPSGITYMPMLWGWKNAASFAQTVGNTVHSTIALGMNEPNEPLQSNMSPSDAVTMWMEYMQPLASQGYKLVSPACTNSPDGTTWYQQFFQGCQQSGCQIDAVAFHGYVTNASDIIAYANMLYTTYNLPVMLTEFADMDFTYVSQPSPSEVQSFAEELTAFIDSTEWMEVVCPFGALDSLYNVAEVNNLVDNGGGPNNLAHVYFG